MFVDKCCVKSPVFFFSLGDTHSYTCDVIPYTLSPYIQRQWRNAFPGVLTGTYFPETTFVYVDVCDTHMCCTGENKGKLYAKIFCIQ